MTDLYVLKGVFCLVLTVLLLGCSEGGTGGTGGFAPPDPDPSTITVSISGYDHKGPFQIGSTVSITQLSATGESGVVRGTTEIISNLGDYEITVESDGPLKIDVSGHYFSETGGEFTDEEIELSAVFDPASGNNRVNVNLLTHLIHSRVLQLIGDGNIDAGQATEMAQTELLLAFSNLLPPVDGPTVFSDLLIINSIQEGDDEAGNGYLLALASVLEQYASNLALANSTQQSLELGNFIDQLADDLGDDGALDLTIEVEADLQNALRELNPTAIYLNLLRIDELLELAIQASDLAAQVASSASSETVNVVADSFQFSTNVDSETPLTATTPVTAIMADINLFIDTDGDGLVNGDDEDDDGDGIADVDDDTPYGGGQ